jgi:8-oxo-dGTP diphosphatase
MLGKATTPGTTVDVVEGDGWIQCGLGHRHWGLFGAAGLLAVRDGDVLLQLRAAGVHHGGTWSIPGGACHPDETPTQAALRESREEIDLPSCAVEPLEEFLDDHGGWSYTTLVARLVRPFEPRHNFESQETRWVRVDEVNALPLHDGFARSWPLLSDIIGGLRND